MPITHHELEVTPNPLPVSGPLTDTELRATPVPVSGSVTATGPLTDTELRATPVPVSGTVNVGNFPGATLPTTTVSRISVGTSTVTLAASNANRRGLVIHNETGTLFVKLGSGASDTDYTYRLVANTTVECLVSSDIVTARKASGTTPVQVSELSV